MMTTSLFSPMPINNITFKNRIGVAPMTRMSAGDNSIPRKDVLDFLVTRAKNNAGLVYNEAIVTDDASAQGYPGQARLLNQDQVDAWKQVTDKIREYGAVSVCQVFHCGRMAYEGINPANRVIGPSPIAPKQDNPMTGAPYPVPEQMNRVDMDVSLFESKAEWQEMIQLFSREATTLPILICGKIHDRKTADEALKDAAMVLSGKSMLLNPNWVSEVEAAKELKLYGSDEAGIAYTKTPLP